MRASKGERVRVSIRLTREQQLAAVRLRDRLGSEGLGDALAEVAGLFLDAEVEVGKLRAQLLDRASEVVELRAALAQARRDVARTRGRQKARRVAKASSRAASCASCQGALTDLDVTLGAVDCAGCRASLVRVLEGRFDSS